MKRFVLFIVTLTIITMNLTIGFGAPLKIGVLYLGSTNDAGWNYAHYRGVRALEKHFESKIQLVEVDGVGSNAANITSTLDSLIGVGCKLIFSSAWDFMDPTVEIAKKNSNIIFEHCSGYKRAENLGTYFVRMYNMDYLAGIVAGRKTKKNLIGLVLPQPIPEVVRQANAFAIGVKKVNPKARVIIVWTHSWYDPATESEFARALIEKGVDVIAHGCDSPAVVAVAQELGVWAIGYGNDQSKYAPDKWLTAPLWKWDHTYIDRTQKVIDGTWKSEAVWDPKGAELAPLSKYVDDQTKAIVQNEHYKIITGQFKVFSGPLYDQNGKLKVEKGNELSDQDIWNIYWLVDNIIGTIPK